MLVRRTYRREENHLSAQTQSITNDGNPLITVLKLKDYRSFWVAQFIAQLIAGALRFAFIWHAPTLGDVVWTAPLMAISTALPAFIVSLPAGAIADRMNHRIYCIVLSAATAILLLLTGALLLTDLLNLYLAVLMAFLLGATGAAGMPVYQAMVPRLVGSQLLASGVALQNLGMMASMVIGAVLGGGLIQFLGMDLSFLFWAALMVLSTLLFFVMNYDTNDRTQSNKSLSSLIPDILAGIRFVFSNEPLRSLTLAGCVMGFGGGAYQTLVPEIGRFQLGLDAGMTSLMFGLMSGGMIISTLFIASRKNLTAKGRYLLFALNCFGPGLMFIGLSTSLWLTFIFLPLWGLCGGILMTTQRTLLQESTPSDVMARVMSVNVFASAGLLPLSAGVIFVLRGFWSAGESMTAIGLIVTLSAVTLAATRRFLWKKSL